MRIFNPRLAAPSPSFWAATVLLGTITLLLLLLLGCASNGGVSPAAAAAEPPLSRVPLGLVAGLKNESNHINNIIQHDYVLHRAITIPTTPAADDIITSWMRVAASVVLAIIMAHLASGATGSSSFVSSSSSSSSLFFFITTVLLSSILLVGCVPGVLASTYTSCPGGVLTLIGQSLSSSTFALPDNCALSLIDCSATDLTFTTPHSGLVLVLSNLDCGGVQRVCIYFQKTVTGGSIDINGVTRTVSGSVGVNCIVVWFQQPVSNVHTVSIKGLFLTFNNTGRGNVGVIPVYFQSSLAGSNSAGSLLNISGNSVTGTGSSTGDSFSMYLVDFQEAVSQFEQIELSSNSVSGVTASASDACIIWILYPGSTITLLGTAASSVTMRSNTMKGNSVTSSRALIYLAVFYHAVSGVSTLTVDGADMRNNTISASTWARFHGIFFHPLASLSMSNSGVISISGVLLGGSLSYGATDRNGYGARAVEFNSLTGVNSISVMDSLLDFSTGSGMSTSAAVEADVIRFKAIMSGIASISVSNASIRGIYTTTGGGSKTDLQIVAFDAAASLSNVTQLSITDCHVLPTTVSATGSVQLYVSNFYGVSSSGINVVDCSARDGLYFASLVTNMTVNVSGLDCLTATAPGGACIDFAGTVMGGNISIDGVKRTVSGSTAGYSMVDYHVVRFRGAVSNVHTLSIKGIALTLGIATSGYGIYIFPVRFLSSLAGSNSAGSLLNISSNSVTGTASSTGGLIDMYLVRMIGGAVSQFEQIELSSNSVSGVTASASTGCTVAIFYPVSTVALLGSPASSITLRSNIMSGNSLTSIGSYVQVSLASLGSVSGVSIFTVDGADLYDNVISASDYARFQGIIFWPGSSLSMNNSATISISGVLLGGSLSYGATDRNGYGARAVQFNSLTGVNSISVTNSLLDFATGSGMSTSVPSVHVLADLVYFNVAISDIASITVSNASIRGIFTATGTVALSLLSAEQVITNITHLVVTGNMIDATASSSSSSVAVKFIDLANFVTGSGSGIFDASNNTLRGSYSSSSSSVCTAVVWQATGAAPSGFSTISSGGYVAEYNAVDGSRYAGPAPTYELNRHCGLSFRCVLNYAHQPLGHATFNSSIDGCKIVISNCTAESITFTGTISSVIVIIKGLVCTATSASSCIEFQGKLLGGNTGGHIEIDGVAQTLIGVSGGDYSAVRFGGSVSGIQIRITGISITLSVISSAALRVAGVFFAQTVSGSSVINISSNSISGTVSSSGVVALSLLRAEGPLSGIGQLFVTGNTIDVAASSSSSISVTFIDLADSITGTGGGIFDASSNVLRGSYISATSFVCTALVWQTSGAAPSGFSSIISNNYVALYNSAEGASFTGAGPTYGLERQCGWLITGCPGGGVHKISGQSLGSATIRDVDGCRLIIEDCSAETIFFPMNSPSVTNLTFIVNHLTCTSAGKGSCIEFQIPVVGGSIEIDGVNRNVSDTTSTSGFYSAVSFNDVRFVHILSIKRVVLTFSVASLRSVNIAVARFGSVLSGSNSSKSILNISSCTVAGTAKSVLDGGPFYVAYAFVVMLFDKVEMRSNSMKLAADGLQASLSIALLHIERSITLAGRRTSSLVLRSNSVRGNSLTGISTEIYLWSVGARASISGISMFTVDGADMRDNTIVSGGWARFQGVFFGGASLSMTHAGSVSVSGVLLGGSMQYGATDPNSYGARVVEFNSLTGVNNISVTDSVIDFSSGSGMITAASVPVLAYTVFFDTSPSGVQFISVQNNSIRGIYSTRSSSPANVDLQIVSFDAAVSIFNVTQLSITDCHVLPTTATSRSGTVTLYISHFYIITSSAITITGCSARDGLYFASLVTNITLNVSGLDCLTATAPGSCIDFASTVMGGNISINGVTRTVGGSASGSYYAVRFQWAVSKVHTLSIKGVALTLGITASGSIGIYPVSFEKSVAGSNSAGSLLNISGNSVTGTATSTGGIFGIYLAYTSGAVSVAQFEQVELSSNSLRGITATARSNCFILLFTPLTTVALLGTPESSITMRSNIIKSNSITSGGYAQIVLAFFYHAVSGVSTFAVDGADMRGNIVSASSFARLQGIFFQTGRSLSMSNSGAISISGVLLGGSLSSGATDATSSGALIAEFRELSGVNSVSVTNSLLDFSTGSGMSTSAASVPVLAYMVLFQAAISGIASIAVSNSSITGIYSSSGTSANTDLQIVSFDPAASLSSVGQLSITDSHVLPTTATSASGTVTLYVSLFYSVTGSGIIATGCSARDGLSFASAVSNLALVVQRLDCLTATAPGSCIVFAKGVTGGSISISGANRTISGTMAGVYSVVQFQGAVSNVHTLSVVGISLILNIATSGDLSFTIAHFQAAVAGSGTAGSVLELSGNTIAGTATSTGGDVTAHLLRFSGTLSAFEQLELVGNSISNLALVASTNAGVTLLRAENTITLSGSNSSAIIMRGNSVIGTSVTGRGGTAQVLVFAPLAAVSGVSAFVIAGADLRDNTISAAGAAHACGAFFGTGSSLTMVHAGAISVSGVLIGGSMSSGAVGGPRVAEFRGLTGVGSISVSDSLFDFGSMSSSAASVPALAFMVLFQAALESIASISVRNSSIRGVYSGDVDLIIISFAAVASLSSVGQLAIVDCHVLPTTVSTTGSVQLYVSNFYGISSSGINVVDCGARDGVSFSQPVSGSNVTVQRLNCGTATAPGSCIMFASTVTGGNINIDGVNRTVSGSTAGGYSMVGFQGAVSNVHTLSIKGIALTLDFTATASISLYTVRFGSLAGSNSAGSLLNISSNSVTGTGSSGGGTFSLNLAYLVAVSQFEQIEVSSNNVSGITALASSSCTIMLLYTFSEVTLLGTAASSITMRGNVMRGNSVTSSGASAQIYLALIYNGAVSGVSTITVDGADMRGNIVSASGFARLQAISFFWPSSSLTMSNSGVISIYGVLLGGSMSSGGVDGTRSYGARVVEFNSLAGVKSISVTGSLLDFSTGSGMTTSAASVPVVAYMISFKAAISGVASITVSNASIKGTYTADDFVTLSLLRAESPLTNISQFSVTGNEIDVTASSSSSNVTAKFIDLANSVTGTGGGIFDASSNTLRGSYTSATSFVCSALAWQTSGAAPTGFTSISSSGYVISNYNVSEGALYNGPAPTFEIDRHCGIICSSVSSVTTCRSSLGCKWCGYPSTSEGARCVQHDSSACDCHLIETQAECAISRIGTGGGRCSWCGMVGKCLNPDDPQRCECDSFNTSFCGMAVTTQSCKRCPGKCVAPDSTSCRCGQLSWQECAWSSYGSEGSCSWCPVLGPEIGTCMGRGDTCSCSFFSIDVCKIKAQQRECKYVGSKCYEPDSAAVSCSALTPSQCNFSSAGAGNACGICPSTQMCHLAAEGSCPCRDLTNDTCRTSFSAGGQCHLCEFGGGAQQTCMPLTDGVANNTRTVTPSCTCSFISAEADCRAASPACRYFSPVLNIPRGTSYCAASKQCAPLTCQVIQRGDVEACRRAGCTPPEDGDPNAPCRAGLCAAYFLEGFVSQPFLLLAAGLLKDVAILLLIGVWGDAMLRPLRKWRARAQRCVSAKPQHELLEARFDETVYILDDQFRDGYDFTMEQYCERLMDRFFVIQSSATRVGAEGEQQTVHPQQLRRKLFNAVAFGMFDQRLWIEPEEGLIAAAHEKEREEEEQQQQLPNLSSFSPRDAEGDAPLLMSPKQQQAPSAAAAANDEIEVEPNEQQHEITDDFGVQLEHDDDEEQQSLAPVVAAAAAPSSTHSVTTMPIEQACDEGRIDARRACEIGSIRTASKMVGFDPSSPALPPSAAFLASHFGVDCSTVEAAMQGRVVVSDQRQKIVLSSANFNDDHLLQGCVSAELRQRALDSGGYQLYYTQSRSLVLKIGAVVNDMPSKPQLAFYSLGVLLMSLSALYTVFGIHDNYEIVKQLSDPSCIAGGANSSSSLGNSSSAVVTKIESGTSAISTAAYFLLAFRIVNSGSFSTAVLVFFKLCRGWWRARNIDSLTLSEMLPILAVKYSAVIKLLIFVYCVQILPFALLGPLYGLPSGQVPVLVPLGIGAGVCCVLALLLWLFSRRSSSSSEHHEQKQKQKLKRSALAADDKSSKEISALADELLPSWAGLADGGASTAATSSATAHRSASLAAAPPLELSHHSHRFGEMLAEDNIGEEGEDFDERSLPNYSEELDSEFDFAHVNFDAIGRKHERQRLASKQKKKSKITDARLLFNALMTFLVRQEVVIIVVTVSLQVATNVCCYLFYRSEFDLENEMDVLALDYKSRTLSCSFHMLNQTVSHITADLSAVLPFF